MQKLKFLKPALSLLIITIGVALLLSVVNYVTADKIEENALKKKMAAIEKIYPEMETFEDIDLGMAKSCVTAIGKVKSSSGDELGYFVEVTPQGFKDVISLVVGVGLDGKVTDVICLSSSETAGIGTKATSSSHLDKYTGLDFSNVDSVDAETGATISSKAVKHGITDACESIRTIMEVE